MNQSSFVVDNSVFHNFSLKTLVTQGKFHVDDKKIIDEKKLSTTFCLGCQHKITIVKRNLHSSGVFWTTGEMGPEDLTVEKEEASTFQAADLTTTVADMLAELHC